MVLAQADADSIVLLENHNNILPLKKNIGSVALIGPQVNRVSVSPFYHPYSPPYLKCRSQFGDYVFLNASQAGISPLDGFKQFLGNSSSTTKINFAQGCELWSNDESGFPAAVQAAQDSDVAVVMVSDLLFCPTLYFEWSWITPGRYLESRSNQSLDAGDECYNGRAR